MKFDYAAEMEKFYNNSESSDRCLTALNCLKKAAELLEDTPYHKNSQLVNELIDKIVKKL